MTSNALRALFLEFFKQHGHQTVASSPLVPGNDPTLLFTNAGMVQFKDVFTGQDRRSYTRAASSQKCLRAGGKHNDLENVGYTARHHTFFEMLGNFSFGDYFKDDAIAFGWEFVTGKNWLNIDPNRLLVTVYESDDEAFDLWKKVGVAESRIVRIGDNKGAKYASDNFWSMGETGPCGPCTEIFYDHDPDGSKGIAGGPPGSPDEDGDRWIEIWNIVFMQFDRDAQGNMTPLPKPSVDTGMGLERVAALMQGSNDNYRTDTFQKLISAIADIAKQKPYASPSQKVIADHIRATSFLIAEGVLPSNEGRGYVLRRIMRRALRHGYKLGINEPFFYRLVEPLASEMGGAFPELNKRRESIEQAIRAEEDSFAQTLHKGMEHFENAVMDLVQEWFSNTYEDELLFSTGRSGGYADRLAIFQGENSLKFVHFIREASLTGNESVGDLEKEVSRFTAENIETFAGHNGETFRYVVIIRSSSSSSSPALPDGTLTTIQSIKESDLGALPGDIVFKLYDTYGFPVDLTADIARERGLKLDEAGYEQAMEGQRQRARAASSFKADSKLSYDGPATQFVGYETLGAEAKVIALFKDEQPVQSLAAAESGAIVLDQTPFYAESGGQVGDRGRIGNFEVRDTQKIGAGFAHFGTLHNGAIALGDSLSAQVTDSTRRATMRNHSATHLMHQALREVLGDHVAQKGSLVDETRTRFDFSHNQPVTAQEMAEIEDRVNRAVMANVEVAARSMKYDDAIAAGAMALFGEKYGDEVRVLSMGAYSTELCGGTHVQRTGDIGPFKIISESGVAAGVRRVEAVTGENALQYFRQSENILLDAAAQLKTGREDLAEKLLQQIERSKQLDKEISTLKTRLASNTGGDLVSQAKDISGVKVLAAKVDGVAGKEMRGLLDQLKDKMRSGVILLGAANGDKVSLIAGVTPDLIDKLKAGELVNFAAAQVGGKGGGKPEMAQAGGSDPSKLGEAIDSVYGWVESKL